jgi:hypothetical protein
MTQRDLDAYAKADPAGFDLLSNEVFWRIYRRAAPYRVPALVVVRVPVCKCDDPSTCVAHQSAIPMGGCPTRGLYEDRTIPAPAGPDHT